MMKAISLGLFALSTLAMTQLSFAHDDSYQTSEAPIQWTMYGPNRYLHPVYCPTLTSNYYHYDKDDKSHGDYSVTNLCTGETRHYTRGGRRIYVRKATEQLPHDFE